MREDLEDFFGVRREEAVRDTGFEEGGLENMYACACACAGVGAGVGVEWGGVSSSVQRMATTTKQKSISIIGRPYCTTRSTHRFGRNVRSARHATQLCRGKGGV